MRTLDPGTMGGDRGWGYRVLMLVVTVGGLIVVAGLIGVVSGGFDDKMVELRKGRSRVIEKDHTVILGWSAQPFTIVSEISRANESRRRSTVVVLADRDKVEMDDAIRAHIPNLGNTAVICRRGNPLSQLDLQLASPSTARSVVVLTDDGVAHSDSAVIKTVMALSNHEMEDEGPPIIAALRDTSNLDAARLAGGDATKWVLAEDLISRITVQTCLQQGLSIVCTELLDFDGDEIYFSAQPELVGVTYLEAQLSFDDCSVIGLARGDGILLNPSADETVRPDDALILIAADDTEIRLSPRGEVDTAAASPSPGSHPKQSQRVLVLGSNSSLERNLEDLSAYLAPGSTVTVVADSTLPPMTVPRGITLETSRADTTSRKVLDALDIARFDHILVLAYRGVLDVQSADAKTPVTLLHLRDIVDRHKLQVNIVSEMLDDRIRELAEVTRADDFIVSDRLTSLMLAQISENRALIRVFEELFSSGGSELYLLPVELYVPVDQEVDFHTVAVSASRLGHTAIGYRVAADARSRSAHNGVRLNPARSEPRTFRQGDRVIVLAESV